MYILKLDEAVEVVCSCKEEKSIISLLMFDVCVLSLARLVRETFICIPNRKRNGCLIAFTFKFNQEGSNTASILVVLIPI